MMLDLSAMTGARVDPERRIAVAEPGLMGDLDGATQVHELATPLGVVSAIGIAGLTLGGGDSWINGKHGLARDSLLAAEVVIFEAMQPFAERAVYVNDLGVEGGDRVRQAYGENYPRLTALKAGYDPTNLFRPNQNIVPAPS